MNSRSLALVAASVISGATGFGQGTVNFANLPGALIYTNALAAGGGTRGPTATNAGGFVYALFIAPATTQTVSVQDLLSGSWTFTGNYASNLVISAGGGRLFGGGGVAVPGWEPGRTNSFAIFGWSATAGQTWSDIAAQISGAKLDNGRWSGGSFRPEALTGFFGLSGVGFGEAGGPDPTTGFPLPPFNLFGTVPNQMGTPLASGFDLYPGAPSLVPEPSPFILLGMSVFLGIRRLRPAASRLR